MRFLLLKRRLGLFKKNNIGMIEILHTLCIYNHPFRVINGHECRDS